MKKKIFNAQKGITLIVLIIMIIIIIILSAVTINILVDEDKSPVKTSKEITIDASIRSIEDAMGVYKIKIERDYKIAGDQNVTVNLKILEELGVLKEYEGIGGAYYIITEKGYEELEIDSDLGKGELTEEVNFENLRDVFGVNKDFTVYYVSTRIYGKAVAILEELCM